jgi:lysozyme family protein
MFDNELDVGLIVHKIVTSVYNVENKTWFDEETGLMWQVKIDASEEHGRLPWNDIFKYCDNKNKENFGGFSDWRVPTIEELETLVTNESHPNCYGYDEESFIKKPLLYSMGMKYGRFWSCTSNNQDYNFAYGVNFNRKRENSQSKKGKKEKYKTRYVRCVRLWREEDIKSEWLKVKDSNDKDILLSFQNKFPNSTYQHELNKILEIIKTEEQSLLDSLSPIEKKLLSYNNHSNMPKTTLLFNAIKEGVFDDMKTEALTELKYIMKHENLWKEKSTSKKPEKDKNYQRTHEIINMLNNISEK